MAKQELEKEGTPVVEETTKEPEKTEVVVVKGKNGIGTALKIGGGLLFAAAFTGLGWILKGILGGGSDDEEDGGSAETEHPAE